MYLDEKLTFRGEKCDNFSFRMFLKQKIYHEILDNLQNPMKLKLSEKIQKPAQNWENNKSFLSAPDILLNILLIKIESERK